MKKINVKNIFTEDNIRKVGSVIGTMVLGYLISNTKISFSLRPSYIYSPADYSNAFNTIMNSNEFGSVKRVLCANLLRDRSTDYYNSVIAIVNSNEFGSTKVTMMADLNENFAKNTSSIVK